MNSEKLQMAFQLFDDYNSLDTEVVEFNGKTFSRSLLYGIRMTDRLNLYDPMTSEALQLAARCQHVGRWEIARSSYPMDKKGYFQWRQAEKEHQCKIAENILKKCAFEPSTIEKVKFLLMKKELNSNEETKLLEDVVCLVFIEFYLDEFAGKHPEEKVIDILKKTMKKMTSRAIHEVGKIKLNSKTKALIERSRQAS